MRRSVAYSLWSFAVNVHLNSKIQKSRFCRSLTSEILPLYRGFNFGRNKWRNSLYIPVVQTLDSAIHRINHYPADNCIREINYAIYWIDFYPVDTAIQRLNNRGLETESLDSRGDGWLQSRCGGKDFHKGARRAELCKPFKLRWLQNDLTDLSLNFNLSRYVFFRLQVVLKCARVSHALLSLRKNGGLLVVYVFIYHFLFFCPYIQCLLFLFPGKAFGGRKTKENRLFIKHLTSTNYFQGFLGNITLAISKILTKNGGFADKSKEKRRVIREQTKETKASLFESILLAKVKLIL